MRHCYTGCIVEYRRVQWGWVDGRMAGLHKHIWSERGNASPITVCASHPPRCGGPGTFQFPVQLAGTAASQGANGVEEVSHCPRACWEGERIHTQEFRIKM